MIQLNNKSLGVVLVNYHTTEQIIEIAKTYESFSCVDRIVIVNNDTLECEKPELLKIESDCICVIFEKDNLGYSKGNNIGLDYLSKHDIQYVIISNSDISIQENTIVKLVDSLESSEKYGALAPRMRNSEGDLVPMRAIPLGYKRLFLQLFINNLDKKTEYKLKEDEFCIVDQSFLPGSFFVCKMDALRRCGKFDPHIFLYREEEILAVRLKRVGYQVGVSNSVSYVHNHPYNKENIKKIIKGKRMEHRSERYFFREYLKATPIQMLYVSFFEFLYTIRWTIRHIIKNGL